jgi:hypothetical protein
MESCRVAPALAHRPGIGAVARRAVADVAIGQPHPWDAVGHAMVNARECGQEIGLPESKWSKRLDTHRRKRSTGRPLCLSDESRQRKESHGARRIVSDADNIARTFFPRHRAVGVYCTALIRVVISLWLRVFPQREFRFDSLTRAPLAPGSLRRILGALFARARGLLSGHEVMEATACPAVQTCKNHTAEGCANR